MVKNGDLVRRSAPEHLSDQNKQQLIKTCDTYFLPTRTITATNDDLLRVYPPVMHKNRGVLYQFRLVQQFRMTCSLSYLEDGIGISGAGLDGLACEGTGYAMPPSTKKHDLPTLKPQFHQNHGQQHRRQVSVKQRLQPVNVPTLSTPNRKRR